MYNFLTSYYISPPSVLYDPSPYFFLSHRNRVVSDFLSYCDLVSLIYRCSK